MENKSNLVWIVLGVGLILWFISTRQEKWEGVYYPSGEMTNPIYSSSLTSKEDCIRWGEGMINSRPQDKEFAPQDLYECGRNCKNFIDNDPLSVRVCEQNFDGGDWRRGDYGK